MTSSSFSALLSRRSDSASDTKDRTRSSSYSTDRASATPRSLVPVRVAVRRLSRSSRKSRVRRHDAFQHSFKALRHFSQTRSQSLLSRSPSGGGNRSTEDVSGCLGKRKAEVRAGIQSPGRTTTSLLQSSSIQRFARAAPRRGAQGSPALGGATFAERLFRYAGVVHHPGPLPRFDRRRRRRHREMSGGYRAMSR